MEGKKKNSGVLCIFMHEPVIVENSLRNRRRILDRFITPVLGDIRVLKWHNEEACLIEIVAWDVIFLMNPTSLDLEL